MTVYKVTLSQAEKSIARAIRQGRVPILKSDPGMGKSSLVRSIADQYNLKLIDCRVTQLLPEDFNGLPMRDQDRAIYAAFKMFPLEGDPIPEGYDGWLLFLDELNSGSKSIQAASYKVLLDHMVGMEKLHSHVALVAAGNLETSNAIVTRMGTAQQSRLLHYTLAHDANASLDIFAKCGYDARIQSFLEWKPELIHKFSPDHTEDTFPCNRTWEFASDMIKGIPSDEIEPHDVAACVGDGATAEFMLYLKEFGNLPTYAQVMADPKGAAVPNSTGAKFAMSSMLMGGDLDTEVGKVLTYLERFPAEFQTIFLRLLCRQHPEMHRHKDVIPHRARLNRIATGRESSNAVAA